MPLARALEDGTGLLACFRCQGLARYAIGACSASHRPSRPDLYLACASPRTTDFHVRERACWGVIALYLWAPTRCQWPVRGHGPMWPCWTGALLVCASLGVGWWGLVLVVRRENLENAMERSMRGLRAARPAAAPRYRARSVSASFGTSGVVRRVELGSVSLSNRSGWASVGSLIWPCQAK